MRNLVLFAMSQKGLRVVEHIATTNLSSIRFVVIGRDSRMQIDYGEDIAQLCERCGIPHYFRGSEPEASKNDYIFAISWRWMIVHPEKRLIVFHDSLLPKYRGFAPLVNSLINGEERIGVTALFGSAKYDKGEIIGREESTLTYPVKISQAIDENNKNYLRLVERIAHKVARGEHLTSTPQDERDATYSIWRDEDDYVIDWRRDASTIKRLIDALGFPYLGAKTCMSKNEIVVITDAEVVEDVVCEVRHTGKIIFVEKGMPVVICGTGLLRITEASVSVDGISRSLLPINTFRVRFGSVAA